MPQKVKGRYVCLYTRFHCVFSKVLILYFSSKRICVFLLNIFYILLFTITVFLNTKDQAGHYQKFELVHDLNIDAEGHTSSETISVLTNPTEELKKLLVRYNFDLKEMKDKKKKKKSKTNEELKNDAKKAATPADSTSSKKQKNKTDEKLTEKQELKKEPRKSDVRKEKQTSSSTKTDTKSSSKRKSDSQKRPSDPKITPPDQQPIKKLKIKPVTAKSTVTQEQPKISEITPSDPPPSSSLPTSSKQKRAIKYNNYWNKLEDKIKKIKIQEVIAKINEAVANEEDDKLARIITILGLVDYDLGIKYQASPGQELDDLTGSELRSINDPNLEARAGFNLEMLKGETMYALCKTFDIHHHFAHKNSVKS